MPCSLLHLPDIAQIYEEATITALDTKRVEVFDYMLERMFTVYKLIDERQYQESAAVIFTCLQIIREMVDYPLLIHVTMFFAAVLQALDLKEESYEVVEFIRDVCEDTYNYTPLMDVFNRMAHLLKNMTEYDRAIVASKKLL